jgi:hypothetical protein
MSAAQVVVGSDNKQIAAAARKGQVRLKVRQLKVVMRGSYARAGVH